MLLVLVLVSMLISVLVFEACLRELLVLLLATPLLVSGNALGIGVCQGAEQVGAVEEAGVEEVR